MRRTCFHPQWWCLWLQSWDTETNGDICLVCCIVWCWSSSTFGRFESFAKILVARADVKPLSTTCPHIMTHYSLKLCRVLHFVAWSLVWQHHSHFIHLTDDFCTLTATQNKSWLVRISSRFSDSKLCFSSHCFDWIQSNLRCVSLAAGVL